jgi:D-alanyl-D-alanine carboxypeptidase (penicillin-binding protein 5/6)
MNAVAQSEGLTGSHFVNPDGYHNKNHYTTARDMQKIGVLALSQPVIRQAMGTQKVAVDLKSDYTSVWENTNKLIKPDSNYYNPDALGMKTGYTNAAGYCLMSAFAAEGKTVLIGVFGCSGTDTRFADAQNIYNAYMQHNKNTLG